MLDRHLYESLERALHGIGLPITVLDAQGETIYPYGEPSRLSKPDSRTEDGLVRQDGYLFQKLSGTPPIYVALPELLPAAEQTLRLASTLVSVLLKNDSGTPTREDMYRRILQDNLNGTELETQAIELGVMLEAERCVLLFQSDGNAQPIVSALTELFDGSSEDCVVALGRNSVALVRSMEHVVFQELPEFVLAVADTVREESGVGFSAGIGEPVSQLQKLYESLQEARSALEIGRTFHPGEAVFLYRSLMVERFLQEVPSATAKKYYELLFNRRNMRVFNEEMVRTIDTFFDCHLNVSEAARRLYIHRNTLVYRLDKVQKSTGLDLRTFEDAITFRMLRMLGRRSESKQ